MRLRNWHKLVLGVAGLFIAVLFLSSGLTPPGPAGEVLRHNQAEDIDASPFFYGDVENMSEYEAGVAAMRDSAEAAAASDTTEKAAEPKSDSTTERPSPKVSGKVCDPIKGECL
ncbi:hypothetical protein KQH82_01965 [bacterium]|nr:hypothetical protein [bacterium]